MGASFTLKVVDARASGLKVGKVYSSRQELVMSMQRHTECVVLDVPTKQHYFIKLAGRTYRFTACEADGTNGTTQKDAGARRGRLAYVVLEDERNTVTGAKVGQVLRSARDVARHVCGEARTKGFQQTLIVRGSDNITYQFTGAGRTYRVQAIG